MIWLRRATTFSSPFEQLLSSSSFSLRGASLFEQPLCSSSFSFEEPLGSSSLFFEEPLGSSSLFFEELLCSSSGTVAPRPIATLPV
jgi:hypothetical protein